MVYQLGFNIMVLNNMRGGKQMLFSASFLFFALVEGLGMRRVNIGEDIREV